MGRGEQDYEEARQATDNWVEGLSVSLGEEGEAGVEMEDGYPLGDEAFDVF